MVKILLSLLLFCSVVMATEDPLMLKVQSFLSQKSYEENKNFIDAIFDPKSDFYQNDRVDTVKVIQTLKDNGLLKLFFKSPQEFQLNFKTNGYPLFFVKLMSDTLRSIGYYSYMTTASEFDVSGFTWSVKLTSEYATDPLVLETQLHKNFCKIINIERNSSREWTYVIDISNAKLNLPIVKTGKELKLKRSLYAHWLNVSPIRSLQITSSRRNSWYPYISYYDSSLHLLKIIKKDKIYRKIMLEMPKNTKYMKISDLYTLQNIRDELILLPKGSR